MFTKRQKITINIMIVQCMFFTLVMPTIQHGPQIFSTIEGTPISLPCRAHGVPKPDITWSKVKVSPFCFSFTCIYIYTLYLHAVRMSFKQISFIVLPCQKSHYSLILSEYQNFFLYGQDFLNVVSNFSFQLHVR